MKKFINQIENVELEMLEGIAKAHPDHLKKLPDFNVLVRAEKKEGKVALISGGGSGHEPAHGGYVGDHGQYFGGCRILQGGGASNIVLTRNDV